MPDIYSSPQKSKNDVQTMRGSTLGQMHQGEVKAFIHHPAQKFFLRAAGFLNAASWLGLWIAFRFKNFFPPHDAPFMSAIGWYFFFGMALYFFAALIVAYGRKVETEAIVRALTNNRSYAWHSQHGTLSTHDTAAPPTSAASVDPAGGRMRPASVQSQVVGAGSRQYRAAGWLIAISLIIWILGIHAIFTELL